MEKLQIKPGYHLETKTFRLPHEIIIKLDTLAHENHLSLNNLVIQCLEFAMKNLEEEKK